MRVAYSEQVHSLYYVFDALKLYQPQPQRMRAMNGFSVSDDTFCKYDGKRAAKKPQEFAQTAHYRRRAILVVEFLLYNSLGRKSLSMRELLIQFGSFHASIAEASATDVRMHLQNCTYPRMQEKDIREISGSIALRTCSYHIYIFRSIASHFFAGIRCAELRVCTTEAHK